MASLVLCTLAFFVNNIRQPVSNGSDLRNPAKSARSFLIDLLLIAAAAYVVSSVGKYAILGKKGLLHQEVVSQLHSLRNGYVESFPLTSVIKGNYSFSYTHESLGEMGPGKYGVYITGNRSFSAKLVGLDLQQEQLSQIWFEDSKEKPVVLAKFSESSLASYIRSFFGGGVDLIEKGPIEVTLSKRTKVFLQDAAIGIKDADDVEPFSDPVILHFITK
jgi:hypothetical protein